MKAFWESARNSSSSKASKLILPIKGEGLLGTLHPREEECSARKYLMRLQPRRGGSPLQNKRQCRFPTHRQWSRSKYLKTIRLWKLPLTNSTAWTRPSRTWKTWTSLKDSTIKLPLKILHQAYSKNHSLIFTTSRSSKCKRALIWRIAWSNQIVRLRKQPKTLLMYQEDGLWIST